MSMPPSPPPTGPSFPPPPPPFSPRPASQAKEDARGTIFHQAGRVAWISVILAVVFNGLLNTLVRGGDPKTTGLIGASVALVFLILGVSGAGVALCGIGRYGRKGLLIPALVGLGLWAVLFVLAIPVAIVASEKARAAQKPIALQPAVHRAGAARAEDPELGYAFDLPAGFEDFPPKVKPAEYAHAYLRTTGGKRGFVILIKQQSPSFPRRHLNRSDFPRAETYTLSTTSWRGVMIDLLRVPEGSGADEFITLNVHIPLRKQYLRIDVGGPGAREEELRKIVAEILASLEGETVRS